ncbi:MAG: hypothetical protein AB1486_04505 [Planctomycetota bacterium]
MFYWVPSQGRGDGSLLRYSDHLAIYRGRGQLADYRPVDNLGKPTAEEERRLRAMGPVIAACLGLTLTPESPQRHHFFVRELHRLAGRMPPGLFTETVERALRFQIASLDTLERTAVLQLSKSTEVLPSVLVHERYREPEA